MRLISALLLLASMPALGVDVRVGVFGLFQPERVTIRPIPGGVLKLTAGARTVVLPANATAGIRAVGSELDLFAQREQSSSREVRVTGRDDGPTDFLLALPNQINRRYRGILELTAGAGRLRAVVLMDLETAVASATAAEMPQTAPAEALKAMAVLARSFYGANRGRHGTFDFCDTTHCQFHREPPNLRSAAASAARETAELVLAYKGAAFAPMYSASCGGQTKASEAATPYPYRSVVCTTCQKESTVWERRLPIDIARALLEHPSEEDRLAIVRKLGWSAVPSNNFTATSQGSEVLLQGRGEGHGIGVCQRGAIGMGATGADFRAILLHFLPDTTLIHQKP